MNALLKNNGGYVMKKNTIIGIVVALAVLAVAMMFINRAIEWNEKQVETSIAEEIRVSELETRLDRMVCPPQANITTKIMFWDHTYIFGRVAKIEEGTYLTLITFADEKQYWVEKRNSRIEIEWQEGPMYRIKLRDVSVCTICSPKQAIYAAYDVQVINKTQCPGV